MFSLVLESRHRTGRKTLDQTIVALIGTDAVGFTNLKWSQIASTSGVAALVSVLVGPNVIDGSPSAISAEQTSGGKYEATG